MKLASIKKVWADLNDVLFNGELPEANHRLTRSNDCWAYWHDKENAYYWNRDLQKVGDFREIVSIIFHEMVHHYGDIKHTEHYKTLENPHDKLFYSWRMKAKQHQLLLKEKH